MAYENPVPLGEAGTGAAYLLPQSQALAGFDNYLDQRNAQAQQEQAARIAAAKQTAKAWQENRLNIKAGRLWQPEINSRANQVMQSGMDLQRAGLDPTKYYGDQRQQRMVDDYNQQRQQVLNMAQTRDEFTKKLDENDKERSKQEDGYYEPADAEHQFMSTPLSKIMDNGFQVPDLKRTYDMQGAIDKLPTSSIKTKSVDPRTGIERELVLPNDRAHADIAHSWLVNTPEAKAAAEKQIGMPLEAVPSTSDIPTLKKQLDQHYRSMPAIPSLAAQGVKTFGLYGDNNSSGVPDANSAPPQGSQAPTSATNPEYDALLTRQATKLSQAKQKYDAIHANVVDQLNDKVSRTNDQGFNFEYDREMRAREERGEGRVKFSQWMKDQQQEPGEFQIGNSNSTVPVPMVKRNADGSVVAKSNYVQPEKGASLFGVNLPEVKQVVSPSSITDLKTGQTRKNAAPVEMTVSRIQMVPVYRNTGGMADDNELSMRQLKESVTGKGLSMSKVTFKPFVYGLQTVKDKNGHATYTPIKVPYDAVKGVNNKKIITTQFDQALDGLQQLQQNPKFIALPADQKLEFIKQHYNISE